jgi:hypothetical protein
LQLNGQAKSWRIAARYLDAGVGLKPKISAAGLFGAKTAPERSFAIAKITKIKAPAIINILILTAYLFIYKMYFKATEKETKDPCQNCDSCRSTAPANRKTVD